MAKIEKILPLYKDPFYSYNASLDKKDFFFTFRYSDRAENYLMSIEDADGNSILKGVKLVCGLGLVGGYSTGEFEGDFLLIPKKDVPFYDWEVEDGRGVWKTHRLVYFIPDEDEEVTEDG